MATENSLSSSASLFDPVVPVPTVTNNAREFEISAQSRTSIVADVTVAVLAVNQSSPSAPTVPEASAQFRTSLVADVTAAVLAALEQSKSSRQAAQPAGQSVAEATLPRTWAGHYSGRYGTCRYNATNATWEEDLGARYEANGERGGALGTMSVSDPFREADPWQVHPRRKS